MRKITVCGGNHSRLIHSPLSLSPPIVVLCVFFSSLPSKATQHTHTHTPPNILILIIYQTFYPLILSLFLCLLGYHRSLPSKIKGGVVLSLGQAPNEEIYWLLMHERCSL